MKLGHQYKALPIALHLICDCIQKRSVMKRLMLPGTALMHSLQAAAVLHLRLHPKIQLYETSDAA